MSKRKPGAFTGVINLLKFDMAGMDEHAYIKSEIRAAIRVLRICARLTMTNDFFDDIEGLNKLVEAILNARKIEERKCKP